MEMREASGLEGEGEGEEEGEEDDGRDGGFYGPPWL